MAARFLPFKTGTFRWGSLFGPRWRTQHRGVDFEAADGTPIYAAEDGTVEFIGNADGFGQWLVLRHPSGQRTVYGHMWNAFATGLKAGSPVTAGQRIASVGANGGSTGPHLHFEVHPGPWRQGSQIDPAPWLNGGTRRQRAADSESLLVATPGSDGGSCSAGTRS